MSYNLVLDEPVADDLVEEHDGLHFVIEKALYESSQGFKVDSVQRYGVNYYMIAPNVESEDAGGCSSCTSCG
jgi:Fe-S cluster assembly iron-binding protein IscA